MPNHTFKTFEIVAGPNGSGKSSFALSFFGGKPQRTNFINADIIATGLAPGREGLAAFRAGRMVLTAVNDAIKMGENVAFESTLSGKTWLSILKTANSKGYSSTIYFIFLNNVNLNLKRIERRVKLGGHSIPEEVVRRRYPRSFNCFWNLYRPECQDWNIFDNSALKPRLILNKKMWDGMTDLDQTQFSKHFLMRALKPNGKKDTK